MFMKFDGARRALRGSPQCGPVRWAGVLALLGGLVWSGAASAQIDFPEEIDFLEEIDCLALNIYFEARGEPDLGKIAVSHVVLNRVADRRFPGTVCEVVRQGGAKDLNRCQFSWWCDGRSDIPGNPNAWKKATSVARGVYWGFAEDPTAGAMWYHADSVAPYWRRAFVSGPKIGQHLFYLAQDQRPRQTASLPRQ